MRNTLQYPVTSEEAVNFLIHLKTQIWEERLIGDIRPVLIDWIVNELEKK